ncbi:MAG: ABC transporter substrate-binding protein [Chloroflexi bacterium]|nr:ABC transporter substrate-binding protein [Chloroflexota bacterium]
MRNALVAMMLLATACAPAPAAPAAAPTAAAKPTAASAAPTAAAAKPTTAAASTGQTGAPIALPKPEQTSLKIAITALEASQLAVPLAVDQGIYKKYGFTDVEASYFDGDAKGLQALVAGQVDIDLSSTGSAIASQLTDVPVVITGMMATVLTDALISSKDVKSAADLKGKKIAVSTYGSTAHGAILLSLKELGLTDQDVTIVQVGGLGARVAALQAGSVAAAPIDISLEKDLTQQGFNVLVRLTDKPIEFGRSGLALRKDWMQKNPNATLALVAATLEGQNMIWTQPDKAADSLVKWAQLKDRTQAEQQVTFFQQTGRRDMRWSKEAFLLAQQVQSAANPTIKDADVTKAYDIQWLDKLRALGFDQTIGLPAS